MSLSTSRRRFSAFCAALVLAASILPPPLAAQPPVRGVMVGRVYEIDKTKYRQVRERMEKQKKDGKRELLDPDEYLVDLPHVTVVARQLPTNGRYSSALSSRTGEYMIRESPAGAFDFTLLYQDVEYPVSQRLDLNVELSYIAELCFVIDREEKKAWMISQGLRRDPEAPPFVPEGCRSALSACLGMLTGTEDGFPEGLLLLLAGSGAAAGTIGILGTDQTEASPPRRQ